MTFRWTMKLPAWVVIVTAVVIVTGAAAVDLAEGERPLVTVSGGMVRGLNTTEYNITYLEFLGIPFATPPVGALRFKVNNSIKREIKKKKHNKTTARKLFHQIDLPELWGIRVRIRSNHLSEFRTDEKIERIYSGHVDK